MPNIEIWHILPPMLTFLRKVRRTLINSGSGQRYLLYAVGEIALVVIGILIALQINNWNTENTQDRIVQNYFQQLSLEFRSIANSEREKLAQSKLIIENIEDCLHLLNQKDPDQAHKLKDCIGYLMTAWTDRPQYPIFQEFIEQGYISKVKIPEIKTLLIKVRTSLLRIKQMDGIVAKKYEEQFLPYSLKHINLSETRTFLKYITPIQGGPPTNFTSFQNDMELWNLLTEKNNLSSFIVTVQEELIRLLEEAVEKLGDDPNGITNGN